VDIDGSGAGPEVNRLERAVDAFERSFILRSLERMDWNVTATARHLGISLSTLKHRMARLNIREIARRIRGRPLD